ncbi:unnamed protein product, partial [Heligmosomoides polygyrus]|uniref:Uncharacterized protein n=1 Tax=Heligmosomoides polygyrus TaxID=6339 RepID=A0A183FAK7_HELPZ
MAQLLTKLISTICDQVESAEKRSAEKKQKALQALSQLRSLHCIRSKNEPPQNSNNGLANCCQDFDGRLLSADTNCHFHDILTRRSTASRPPNVWLGLHPKPGEYNTPNVFFSSLALLSFIKKLVLLYRTVYPFPVHPS